MLHHSPRAQNQNAAMRNVTTIRRRSIRSIKHQYLYDLLYEPPARPDLHELSNLRTPLGQHSARCGGMQCGSPPVQAYTVRTGFTPAYSGERQGSSRFVGNGRVRFQQQMRKLAHRLGDDQIANTSGNRRERLPVGRSREISDSAISAIFSSAEKRGG